MDENGYFLWEDQEWTFFNLDDLGDGSDENSHRKVLNFNVSNSQSLPLPKMDAVHLACGKMVAPLGGNSGGNVQGNEYKGNGNGRELLGHERYLWTERDRRKKIKNMFTILQDLLQLPPKVDRSTILDEAVKHIETLQNTLNHLTEQKLGITKMAKGEAFPIVFKNWTSPNVALNVCGNDAHINICCSIKLGFLSSICSVLEKYKIEVLSALVSSEDNRIMCMIHARVVGEYACQLPAEEIYKQAIEEIITICG